jgi:hypothetical protein
MSEERDLSASIHQRLLNKAKADQIPFGELLQYFAIERFLYRLSKSVYRNSFILKGAMVFLAWNAPFGRPTRDIDFLGITDNSFVSNKWIRMDYFSTTQVFLAK